MATILNLTRFQTAAYVSLEAENVLKTWHAFFKNGPQDCISAHFLLHQMDVQIESNDKYLNVARGELAKVQKTRTSNNCRNIIISNVR